MELYWPAQLKIAYGVPPPLGRGTDATGETVVLPELVEPQFPLAASDIRAGLDLLGA